MRKRVLLSSVLVVSNIYAGDTVSVDSLSAMFSEGKVSGQIREFSISRAVDYSNPSKKDYTRNANAVGGHLKFETANFSGLSFGTAFYTTNGFLNDSNKTDYKKVDPSLLGVENDSYAILGEAYLQYKRGKTTFKAGRQKLNTPLAGSDDARMLPNLFEAYVLTNSDISNTTLLVAHVTKFAQGTFGRVYGGGILAVTGGYSVSDDKNQVGDFVNMGTYALGGKSTDGVTTAAAIFKNDYLKAQVWDYYAYDILNALYGQVDVSWKCLLSCNIQNTLSAQVISESDIGDHLAGDVQGLYVGAKFTTKVENFKAYVAYSTTSENEKGDAFTKNAIITPWGGVPAFTQGMVTRHMFLAGTDAVKVAASYNWKAFGPDLSTTLYYAQYSMNEYNGYTHGDASESGFDFIYKPKAVKNLNLRLRANYAEDFNVANDNTTVGWNEYRFIMNYNF